MSARRIGVAVAAGSMLTTAAAFAAVTQDFTVNLKITPECVVGVGSNISFADTGYLDSDVEAAGSIMVGCTKGTVPKIKLNNGSNTVGCPATTARCMKSTANEFVNYSLYTDSGRSDSWDSGEIVNGPAGDGADGGFAGAANMTVEIFGRVPPQPTPTPGDYTDTVTATVEF